ncbi:flavodoxin domain-containing protein [Clostridium sp. DL1XJH146]
MKKIILCPKKTGNTYNVCSYISENTDFEIMVIDENSKIEIEKYDIILLSSGIYANKVHKNIAKWINNIDTPEKEIGKVFLLLTWFGRGNSDSAAFNQVKTLLKIKKIMLQENYSKCFGQGMGFVRKNHPDKTDKENILKWVKEL